MAGQDLNRLPYVVEDRAGNPITVQFLPFLSGDQSIVAGSAWNGSAFQSSWVGLAGAPRILKLVDPTALSSAIMGLLTLGDVTPGSTAIRNNMLETAPAYQYSNRTQSGVVTGIKGIGRVLVARLVAESYNQGGDGSVLVRPRPASVRFYVKIGFVAVGNVPGRYLLKSQQATHLFERVTQ